MLVFNPLPPNGLGGYGIPPDLAYPGGLLGALGYGTADLAGIVLLLLLLPNPVFLLSLSPYPSVLLPFPFNPSKYSGLCLSVGNPTNSSAVIFPNSNAYLAGAFLDPLSFIFSIFTFSLNSFLLGSNYPTKQFVIPLAIVSILPLSCVDVPSSRSDSKKILTIFSLLR